MHVSESSAPTRASQTTWRRRLRKLRGEDATIHTDLSEYRTIVHDITARGDSLIQSSDARLRSLALDLKQGARAGAHTDDLLVDAFALVREAAARWLGMRPFEAQVLAGLVLHRGRLAEMRTGEGKTLAAVLPAFLHALSGQGVHVLTHNDYLARRDADWMGPVYRGLGLSVAAIGEEDGPAERRAAYAADVTYVTAREAGFDFLRMNLVRDPGQGIQRPFHFAIVDEADSILIDEARVPLVIAGQRPASRVDPYRVAAVVGGLDVGLDFDTDENRRNVFLTDRGLERVERELDCGPLHDRENGVLLTEVHQALHARVLLRRDVDYIVRAGRIEVVDELTGRVVDDRRWPDGLQAALEAWEGLAIRPGGRILGSIALQHFVRLYPRLAGMTATAQSAADELAEFYGLHVVVIPPNRPCVRRDLPDLVFADKRAKRRALLAEIQRVHRTGRPILVGTASVEESEGLARELERSGLAGRFRVLNAKNDEEEARIVARAGALDALTISTNMAGRGTDIRLGGADERDRGRVVELGGLYVIGTNRHESRRIDDQLRGRAGRQGDPGSSRFFVSLEDALLVRFGVDAWIPARRRPARDEGPLDSRFVRRGIDWVQRVVEGQNFEIRRTLWRYSMLVEEQRRIICARREALLLGAAPPPLCAERAPGQWAALRDRLGEARVAEIEQQLTLAHLDLGWEQHLARISEIREGIHLMRLGGLDPLDQFARRIIADFDRLLRRIERHVVRSFRRVDAATGVVDLDREGLRAPTSTWTYLISDRGVAGLNEMLIGARVIDPFSSVIVLPLKAWFARWRRSRPRPSSETRLPDHPEPDRRAGSTAGP